MLTALRNFSKSWVALIFIGLLILSFAIFGINDVFSPQTRDAVITAGDRTVTSAQYRRAFDNYRRQIEEQYGQPVSIEFAAENGLDRQLLEMLARDEAIGELLHRIGVRPSGRLVARTLQEIPAFFDPITGAFDKEAYQTALRQQGVTPQEFERDQADAIARQHLGSAFAAGLQTPRIYAATTVLHGLEQRDAGFFVLSGRQVEQPAPPTEAQLTQFMNENAAQLTRPEYRVLTIVRFSPENISQVPEPTEEEIKARYAYRQDTVSQPETRTLVQIPVKDAAAGRTVAERLRKGEAPAAVAKSLGVDPVVYQDRPRTAIADRKVADAAFAMAAGQVSDPIQGDLGMAVVKVESVTPGRARTLEEMRPILIAELRQEAAAQAVYEQSEVYEEAHAGGASLPEAAKKAGAPVVTLAPVSRQGADPEGQPVQGVTPQMLEIAFNLPAGGESDLQEFERGQYYALRVERIVPAALPELDEIRPQLTQVWMQRELEQRVRARAEELLAKLRAGESLESVAGSAGSPVARAVGLDRQSAGQNPQLGPAVMGAIFATRPGEPFTVNAQSGVDMLIGRVEAVRPPQTEQAAQFVQMIRPRATPQMFEDIVHGIDRAARTKLRVRTDIDRARRALGLEPLGAQAQGGAAQTEPAS